MVEAIVVSARSTDAFIVVWLVRPSASSESAEEEFGIIVVAVVSFRGAIIAIVGRL